MVVVGKRETLSKSLFEDDFRELERDHFNLKEISEITLKKNGDTKFEWG